MIFDTLIPARSWRPCRRHELSCKVFGSLQVSFETSIAFHCILFIFIYTCQVLETLQEALVILQRFWILAGIFWNLDRISLHIIYLYLYLPGLGDIAGGMSYPGRFLDPCRYHLKPRSHFIAYYLSLFIPARSWRPCRRHELSCKVFGSLQVSF